METIIKNKKIVLVLVDIVLINLSYILAFYIRFTYHIPYRHIEDYKDNLIAITAIYIICFSVFKLYKSLWIYASIDEFLMGIGGCITASIFSVLYGKFVGPRLPYSVSLLAGVFSVLLVIGFRISFRVYRRIISSFRVIDKTGFKRVLVIGAGYSGNMIIKEMHVHKEMNYNPVYIIDDSKSKKGLRISGVEVIGNRNKIIEVVIENNIDIILIAIPSLNTKNKEEIINICKKTKCKLKIIPGMYDLISQKSTLSQIRDINVEDLLGREPIRLDMDGISDYISDKTVLVTGGGGSIGSELCRQIVIFKPKLLIVFDIYENNAYELQMELLHKFPTLNLKVLIGSVRDKNRVEQIFQIHKPEVVFHAAAHKHVPLMEDNPCEAVKNNVFGTLNVVEASHKYEAKRFVLISTDKAVNPTNIMGATKRICEMIVQAIDKKSNTEFVAVRFGNVLGSNGSVIPLFKNQIAHGGPITLTHKDINRFFMTIPEASQLVLQAGAFAKVGEIFVLDMGKPVRIYDLACDLIRLSGLEPNKDIEIEITGLRPGEKLYEEVLMDEEGLNKTDNEKIFIGSSLHIEYNTLKNELNELRGIIERNEIYELVGKLKQFVPSYKEMSLDEVAVDSEVG